MSQIGQIDYFRAVHYRHSGKAPLSGVFAGFAVAVVVAFLAGAIYGPLGFMAQLIPYAKLSAIIIIGMQLGVGFVIAQAAARTLKWGRVRNTPLAVVLAMMATVLSIYVAWIFWIYALMLHLNAADLTLFQIAWPPQLWDIILQINEHGVWGIAGDSAVSGIALWACWVMEACIILGTVAFTVRKAMNAVPFCETCRKWGATRLLTQPGPLRSADLAGALSRKQFTFLENCRATVSGDRQWFDIFLEGCSDCDTLQTLTLLEVLLSYDRKGNAKRTRKTLIHRMVLTPDDTLALAQAAAVMIGPKSPSAGTE